MKLLMKEVHEQLLGKTTKYRYLLMTLKSSIIHMCANANLNTYIRILRTVDILKTRVTINTFYCFSDLVNIDNTFYPTGVKQLQ